MLRWCRGQSRADAITGTGSPGEPERICTTTIIVDFGIVRGSESPFAAPNPGTKKRGGGIVGGIRQISEKGFAKIVLLIPTPASVDPCRTHPRPSVIRRKLHRGGHGCRRPDRHPHPNADAPTRIRDGDAVSGSRRPRTRCTYGCADATPLSPDRMPQGLSSAEAKPHPAAQ